MCCFYDVHQFIKWAVLEYYCRCVPRKSYLFRFTFSLYWNFNWNTFFHMLHKHICKILCCSRVFRWFQIELARTVGYTTARYGHVMFPENVYEPALECAELLLEGVGKGQSFPNCCFRRIYIRFPFWTGV